MPFNGINHSKTIRNAEVGGDEFSASATLACDVLATDPSEPSGPREAGRWPVFTQIAQPAVL